MYKIVFHGVRNTGMFDPASEQDIGDWRRSVTGFGKNDLDAFKATYQILVEMAEKDLIDQIDQDFEDGIIEPTLDQSGGGWGSFHAVTVCWGGVRETEVVADDGDAA